MYFEFICWKFAGSCKHPIKDLMMLPTMPSPDRLGRNTPHITHSIRLGNFFTGTHNIWRWHTVIAECSTGVTKSDVQRVGFESNRREGGEGWHWRRGLA